MEKMTRRKLLAAAGATTVAATASSVLMNTQSADAKVSADGKPPNKRTYHFEKIPARVLIQRRHLPNVPLITMDGKKVHFYDDLVKNRRVVTQFLFTRCQAICPLITDHLVAAEKMLDGRVGHDIFFYSISLWPEVDRPKELRAFAKAHGADWTFLTGTPADILLLRRSMGFLYNNPVEDADRNNHTGMIMVGDEPLTRWTSCEGGASPKWIASVIRNEADSPFKGSVNGVRQTDPALHVKGAAS